MADKSRDILLVGDTFVFNYEETDSSRNAVEDDDARRQLLQKVGFEDSFLRALRQDFQEDALADEIADLLNESTNPALLHLASILERENFTCDAVNCSSKHREKLVHLLKSVRYKYVGISTTFTLEFSYITELVKLVRALAPGSKVIVGGMFFVKLFKLESEDVIQQKLAAVDADYVVFNDIGEQALVDTLKYEEYSQPDIRTVPNVAYRTRGGYAVNCYLVNAIESSVSNWTLSRRTTYAFLRTSMSCLFKCRFCDYPVIADRHQTKPMATIRQEFEGIKQAGIKYVRFLDDTFNTPKQHFREILGELSRVDYGFEWVAYIRCQYLDKESVELMRQSGCIGVFLGLESGNDGILRNMNKGASVRKYLEGISLLHEHSIPAYGAFVVGYPGETDQTVEDTINFINEARLKYYRLFTWVYCPLAPVAEDREKYAIEVSSDGWKHSTMTSFEALNKCKLIMREVSTSAYCTIPYDYALYLNRNPRTTRRFNECLIKFNAQTVSRMYGAAS